MPPLTQISLIVLVDFKLNGTVYSFEEKLWHLHYLRSYELPD
jgi:hypothetical protein